MKFTWIQQGKWKRDTLMVTRYMDTMSGTWEHLKAEKILEKFSDRPILFIYFFPKHLFTDSSGHRILRSWNFEVLTEVKTTRKKIFSMLKSSIWWTLNILTITTFFGYMPKVKLQKKDILLWVHLVQKWYYKVDNHSVPLSNCDNFLKVFE